MRLTRGHFQQEKDIPLRDYLVGLVGGWWTLRDTAVAVRRVAATVVVPALVALLQVAVLRAARTLRRNRTE